MQYFEGLTDIDAIKSRYKELAKKFHPDLGGCVESMKRVNEQYESVITGHYQKQGKSITEIDELLKNDEGMRIALNKIIALDGLEIEICGFWLWVTGNTKDYKCIFKESGFYWASKKKAWYFRNAEYKSRNRKNFSLNEIREKWGSVKLGKKENQKISCY